MSYFILSKVWQFRCKDLSLYIEGDPAWKFRKQRLAQKVHPLSQLFGLVWRIITWIYPHQSIDINLLTYHKNVHCSAQLAQKWQSYGQKTYAQTWACASYLGHKLFKYQYFEWNQRYLICTSKLHIFLWFIA